MQTNFGGGDGAGKGASRQLEGDIAEVDQEDDAAFGKRRATSEQTVVRCMPVGCLLRRGPGYGRTDGVEHGVHREPIAVRRALHRAGGAATEVDG